MQEWCKADARRLTLDDLSDRREGRSAGSRRKEDLSRCWDVSAVGTRLDAGRTANYCALDDGRVSGASDKTLDLGGRAHSRYASNLTTVSKDGKCRNGTYAEAFSDFRNIIRVQFDD
jgi:hypothetical protein